MKVNRNKTRQHYFEVLNIQTKTEELIRLNWQNTDNITDALRELAKRHPDQKLCIAWDNAMWTGQNNSERCLVRARTEKITNLFTSISSGCHLMLQTITLKNKFGK